mmetsp:Transcript_45127/g.106306  ORF Transcript_45127/g.106306 Transcript_45127/m.106306 type:complete len:401 (-) Transcript_45127:37-1239(-)
MVLPRATSPSLEGKHRVSTGRDVLSPQRQADAFKKAKRSTLEAQVQKAAGKRDYKQTETLTVKVNVYDLVWESGDGKGKGKNAGLVDIGLGFFHSGLEIWGKEISFGHSKRYQSGVFAVKPKSAQEYMPHTRFRTTVEIASVNISRQSVDQLLSRLAAKYTSNSYDVIRNNCNHFTEELCIALCAKSIPEWINRPAKMGASALEALSVPFKAVNSFVSLFAKPQKSTRVAAQASSKQRPKTPEAAANPVVVDPTGLTDRLAQVASAAAVPESADKIGVDGVDSPKAPCQKSSVQNWLATSGATPAATPKKALPREPTPNGSNASTPGKGSKVSTPRRALRETQDRKSVEGPVHVTPMKLEQEAEGEQLLERTQPIASRTRRASGGDKENDVRCPVVLEMA